MTTYNFQGEFEDDSENTEHAQEYFLNSILDVLPDGAKAQVKQETFILDIADLTEDYTDYHIAVTRLGNKNVYGTIEMVLDGSSEYRKVVVINGKAHELFPYEFAVLTAPVSVGFKEADPIPEAEVIEKEVTQDEILEQFSTLAQSASENVGVLGSLITRDFAGLLIDEEITPEEFQLLIPGASATVQNLINATLLANLRDVLAQVRARLAQR